MRKDRSFCPRRYSLGTTCTLACLFLAGLRRYFTAVRSTTTLFYHEADGPFIGLEVSTVKKHLQPTSCPLWKHGSYLLHTPCIESLARIYPSRDPQSWCVPPDPLHPNRFLKQPHLIDAVSNNNNTIVGLVFVKNPKAASSTGAGVTLRMAHRVGQRILLSGQSKTNDNNSTTATSLQLLLAASSCVRNWTHAFANHRGHAMTKRNERRSVAWTIVRDPARRDVSAFLFFEHARQGVPPTDDNMLEYLQAGKSGQFRYLWGEYIADHHHQAEFVNWWHRHNKTGGFNRVFASLLELYDFIAVAERMEESLAVLTLLWNVRPSDVIVLSSKTKGGYDDGKFQKQCRKIPHAEISRNIQDYLQSSKYQNDNLDHPLYALANASLDKTIAFLGVDRVTERRQLIRNMQTRAEMECSDKAVYPCSSNGVLQRAAARKSCYIDDSGCGHACVDAVLQREFADYV